MTANPLQIANCKLQNVKFAICNLQFAICNLQFFSPDTDIPEAQ